MTLRGGRIKIDSPTCRPLRRRSPQLATALVWLALGQAEAALAKNLLVHGSPDGRSQTPYARNVAGPKGALPERTRNLRNPTRHNAALRGQILRQDFSLPHPGERRFVPNEVLLEIPANISLPALEAVAHRHHLTLIGSIGSSTSARRLQHWRI